MNEFSFQRQQNQTKPTPTRRECHVISSLCLCALWKPDFDFPEIQYHRNEFVEIRAKNNWFTRRTLYNLSQQRINRNETYRISSIRIRFDEKLSHCALCECVWSCNTIPLGIYLCLLVIKKNFSPSYANTQHTQTHHQLVWWMWKILSTYFNLMCVRVCVCAFFALGIQSIQLHEKNPATTSMPCIKCIPMPLCERVTF